MKNVLEPKESNNCGGHTLNVHAHAPNPRAFALRKVMFLKTEHAKAIECYRAVLKQKPNNYKALQKLIGLLRRAGQLNEVLQ